MVYFVLLYMLRFIGYRFRKIALRTLRWSKTDWMYESEPWKRAGFRKKFRWREDWKGAVW